MNIKKTLSVLLVGIMILSAFCYPLTSIAAEDYSYKIDKALAEKLETMDDDEEVSVSVWVEDIDHEAVKAQALATIKGKVSDDVYEIARASDNIGKLLGLKEKESAKSIEQQKNDSLEIQKFVAAVRKISSGKYIAHNKQIFNKIIGKPKKKDYICKYAPNANVILTKGKIKDIIKQKNIVSIYYSPDIKFKQDNREIDLNQKSISSEFYTVTGLYNMRHIYGFDGSGMRVGMLELYSPRVQYVTNRTTYKSYGNNSTGNHSTKVAKLMVGKIDDYIGAIPFADLYYANNKNNINCIKPAIEDLLDDMVTAVNLSFGYTNGLPYNTYGDYAKWYDHVALYHNVHLVFAAGNFGLNGIPATNMSYNSIVVGACGENNEIYNNSSFVNDSAVTYKPDMIAPGFGNNVFVDETGSSEAPGTSFAAPLVTSAVIQLAQANAVLEVNPTLMKAFLMSGSKITSYMSSEPVYSQNGGDSIALSRQYGSGMLNVINSYVAAGYNYYITGQATSGFTPQTTPKTIKGLNKKIRVALCWDKKVLLSGDHSQATATNQNLDRFRLKVTSPSGKVFKSSYEYDNKQMVTIYPGEKGTYSFTVERMTGSYSGYTVNYAIAYSIQV